MKSTVLSVTGWEEAITTLFMSKRTWTSELGCEIRKVCEVCTNRYGRYIFADAFPVTPADKECNKMFLEWTSMLFKWGSVHITMNRFLDISIMTEGMHRAGQDDIDSHARRFDNRIIRTSTRLTSMDPEKSSWYQGKIKTDSEIADILGIEFPETVEIEGEKWVKSTNGYVKEEFSDDKDVKRGLYMLSLPSNFISKINVCEWGHVFKERCNEGGANPEVKEWAEAVTAQLASFHPLLTRDYIKTIKN